MEVRYARISSQLQNEERQINGSIKSFVDKCSGAIKFNERPSAKKLINYLQENPNTITSVISVDRIGRSTLDILETIKMFKDNNWVLKIDNLGMDNSSPFFDLMISLLGTLAEHERQVIKDRCRGGIEVAKSKGIYTGRKKGTIDSRESILKKHSDVVKCLKSNMKISDISTITNKTRNTIYKVKSVL
jgi:DNA invertase Pin-like site-specific DNA recombinase